MKLIIGITGASGIIHAVRLLETLSSSSEIETHVIMSDWAVKNLYIETDFDKSYINSISTKIYSNYDLAASPSSGSFKTDGMIIIPCSMKTLSAVSCGFCDNLITRSAEVCIKEGRKLVISPRETPLDSIQLENMLKLARLGVRIVPPMPAYYSHPKTIEDIIDHHIMKILDQFSIDTGRVKRWSGSEEIE